MISIRSQLLLWLLPAFAVIFTAAGFGIHYSTRHELDARLDTRLTALASTLNPTTRPAAENRQARRLTDMARTDRLAETARADHLMVLNSVLTNLPESAYCELRMGSRKIHAKTDNLKSFSLPAPDKIPNQPILYDATLDNGDPVRIWAGPVIMIRNVGGVRAVIALSRKDSDQTLSRLSSSLIIGGLVSMLLLSGLLISALQVSLKPLRQLGAQAAGMDTDSLHERFHEKSVPADIRSIAVRLNTLMSRLEEGFARERRVTADIAHELRTPLAAIRTTSEVAAKWPDQASPEDFQEITGLAAGLQQTLDSLLLLARMESSKADPIYEAVQPQALVKECLLLHSPKAEERHLHWNLQLDNAVEIETDPRLLRIIISNLITNAVEYSPENNEVLIRSGGDDIIFQCSNAAPHLSAEDLPHLFERLWRKDPVRTESGHTGLGLSIADACASSLGLKLCAEFDRENRLCISVRKARFSG